MSWSKPQKYSQASRHFLNNFFKFSSIASSVFFISACSDDGGNSTTITTSSFPVAGTEAGAYTINASGGNGNSLGGGQGGSGGNVNIFLAEGLEGRLEILDNGIVDASFATPSKTADTGTSGETITTSTTISIVSSEPATGLLYMVANDTKLYKSDTATPIADPSEIVSGLTIDAAATLTLELNASTASSASLTFTDDFENNGTVTTVANGTAKGDLNIWAKNILLGSNSSIITNGSDNVTVDGGAISLTADYTISNMGLINSSGFTDADTVTPVSGGNAGNINLSSTTSTYNLGDITATGGAAADGTGNDGGDGGVISIFTQYGDLNNSGSITNSGGNADVIAGNSNAITLEVKNVGNLHNSGNLTSNGGNSTTDFGGAGGKTSLTVLGGDIKNSGDLSNTGGSAADNGMTGGKGGNIDIKSGWGDFETPPGNILISGNINMAGGSITEDIFGGSVGGAGGSLLLSANLGSTRGSPQLVGLWGYTSISTNGGNGETGKNAGLFRAQSSTGQAIAIGNNIEWRSSGSVINEANISTKGGDSTSTTVADAIAGTGGNVYLETENTNGVLGETLSIANSGNIVSSSGNNFQRTSSNIASGTITMNSSGNITNSGTLTSDGGNDNGDVSNPGLGNKAGTITLSSITGATYNSAVISAAGGDGKLAGGEGSNISMFGGTVTNTADLTTNGGNADVNVTSSTGGKSGDITLVAKMSGGASNTGSNTLTGGTGKSVGQVGRETIGVSGM